MEEKTTIRIGTRKSELALWQARHVQTLLESGGMRTEIVLRDTIGDKILNTSIAKIGSKGVFTQEIEEMLLNGGIDIAVHSAKDMPSNLGEGLELIAFSRREKANDVLVSCDSSVSIDDSKRPLVVGTSSVRRIAMLKHYYPHVKTVDMRGNLQTRFRKMEEGACDALMLAFAGVNRMDYTDKIVHVFPEEKFLPPAGQGAVAVEIATHLGASVKNAVKTCVNCLETESRIQAERAFLERLQGGCSIPVFAYATLSKGRLSLSGGLVSLDGKTFLSHTMEGNCAHPVQLGQDLGQYILDNGGKELLLSFR